MKFNVIALALTTLVSSSAFAQNWMNRAQVVRAADVLQEEVERFDESLHETNAPADLIEIVHHFEETVAEFYVLAQQASRAEAEGEWRHIAQDIQLIREKLERNSWVLQYPTVNTEWRHVRTAYRNLDHQMFIRAGRSATQREVEANLQSH